MIDQNAEINRLRDLLPASARMRTRLMLSATQPYLIQAKFPKPWNETHPVTLNLTLWPQLTQAERDLLFLRTVCWVTSINLLQPGWYQGLVVVGLLGTTVELVQANALGLLITGGLTTLAGVQIWRSNRNLQIELAADERAVQVAQWRGYTEAEAVQALLSAIEAVPRIEGKSSSEVTDLVRCRNLQKLAKLTQPT